MTDKSIKRLRFLLSLAMLISFMGSSVIAYDQTVYHVQKKLKELGYNPGSLDGIMGKKTRRAIRGFQRDNSLPVTGEMDEETKIDLRILDEGTKQSSANNEPGNFNTEPLATARTDGIDVVKASENNASDFNEITTIDGWTALIVASYQGHGDTVKALLDKGEDVNAKTRCDGWTALIVASYNGHTEIVKTLLDKGADVNIKTRYDGWTALMYAAGNGHTEIVKELLNKHADVNARTMSGGWTASRYAEIRGHRGVVNLLENVEYPYGSYSSYPPAPPP